MSNIDVESILANIRRGIKNQNDDEENLLNFVAAELAKTDIQTDDEILEVITKDIEPRNSTKNEFKLLLKSKVNLIKKQTNQSYDSTHIHQNDVVQTSGGIHTNDLKEFNESFKQSIGRLERNKDLFDLHDPVLHFSDSHQGFLKRIFNLQTTQNYLSALKYYILNDLITRQSIFNDTSEQALKNILNLLNSTIRKNEITLSELKNYQNDSEKWILNNESKLNQAEIKLEKLTAKSNELETKSNELESNFVDFNNKITQPFDKNKAESLENQRKLEIRISENYNELKELIINGNLKTAEFLLGKLHHMEKQLKLPKKSDSEKETNEIKFGNLENEIASYYNKFLLRDPSEDEIICHLNELSSGKLYLNDILKNIQFSLENKSIQKHKDVIDKFFKTDSLLLQQELKKQKHKQERNALHFVDLKKIVHAHSPLSERLVEYLYVLKNLTTKGKLLDIGCNESEFANELSKIKTLQVYGIDIRPILGKTSYNFFKEDAQHTRFDNDFFDQITIISSIEHFGLEVYGNKNMDTGADVKAMKEIRRILKKNGRLFLTTPFGKDSTSWYRKYNKNSLIKLFSGFKIIEEKYFYQTENGWKKTDVNHASTIGNAKYAIGESTLPGAIVVVIARPEKN